VHVDQGVNVANPLLQPVHVTYWPLARYPFAQEVPGLNGRRIMPEDKKLGVKVKVPGSDGATEEVADGNTIQVQDGHLVVSHFGKIVAIYAPEKWINATAPAVVE
jgi:hypothetical protein